MFKIITDYDEIHRITTEPWCVQHGFFDDSPIPELFFTPPSRMVVRAGQFGAFILDDRGDGVLAVHLALYKYTRGRAKWLCSAAIEWAKKALPKWKVLLAQVPAYNHQVEGLAKRLGFEYIGDDLITVKKYGQEHKIKNYILRRKECPKH